MKRSTSSASPAGRTAPSVPAAEFAAIALFAGRLNRLLARWAAANTCYQRAEDAAGRRATWSPCSGRAWAGPASCAARATCRWRSANAARSRSTRRTAAELREVQAMA